MSLKLNNKSVKLLKKKFFVPKYVIDFCQNESMKVKRIFI